MQEITYIYEDDDLVVCCKPAGIATQTKRLGQKDMESLLKNHVAAAGGRTGRGGVPFIGVVHRLDQPVEGVMVFAKTPQAASKLSAQMQNHSIGKKYYALVRLPEGCTGFASATGRAEEGTLCDEILFDTRANFSRIVPPGTKGAKRAKAGLQTDRSAGWHGSFWTSRCTPGGITRSGSSWRSLGHRSSETANTERIRKRHWRCAPITSHFSIRKAGRKWSMRSVPAMKKYKSY